jgi:hypothetical protein
VSIDIKCRYWPVTAKWDNTIFDDPCREGSVFTSLHPGLWWDVATPSDLGYCILSDNSEVSFTSDADEYFYPGGIGENSYINSDYDTIPVFWVALGTDAILWEGTYADLDSCYNNIILSPNPAHDYMRLALKGQINVKYLEVYNLTGNKQSVAFHDNEIDISQLISGFYYIKMTDNENKMYVKKFIKY